MLFAEPVLPRQHLANEAGGPIIQIWLDAGRQNTVRPFLAPGESYIRRILSIIQPDRA